MIAGLDLVFTSMKACIALPVELSSAFEMLEDVIEASNSAILILNDLLDYESMDAGILSFPMQFSV